MKETPFLTVPEVARLMRRTPARIYQMIRSRELPAVEVGGRIVVPRPAWTAWLQQKNDFAQAAVVDRVG